LVRIGELLDLNGQQFMVLRFLIQLDHNLFVVSRKNGSLDLEQPRFVCPFFGGRRSMCEK
jgi:hypothetical protein